MENTFANAMENITAVTVERTQQKKRKWGMMVCSVRKSRANLCYL